MYRIFIVEDDQILRELIGEELVKWGMCPMYADCYDQVYLSYTQQNPHLVLLDITLPYYDGFYWCEQIRRNSNVPILFLSSRAEDQDKVRAMYEGGDDYIEKPFSMDILIAKIKALLRRAYDYTDVNNMLVSYQNIVLDLQRSELFFEDRSISLTQNECSIMSMLITESEKIVTRSKMMKSLWRDEFFIDENTLTVNVNRLRNKLKGIGLIDCIHTIKGKGYRLDL